MVVLIKAAQLILSLSILVVVHEFGHFAFARLFKTRVEKFRLFFDPWFTPWKKQIGETEYGIGWLPLGGYVKISGMIDESMDKEQMAQPVQPYEFRAKPAWQRLLIMIGGVLFNLILAGFIYTMVLWTWGDAYLPAENVKYGVVCSETAEEIGFQNGDIILKVDGEKVNGFHEIPSKLLLDGISSITVLRNNEQMDIPVNEDHVALLIQNSKSGLFMPRIPFEVDKFPEGSGARKAGMEKDDRIVAVNGKSMTFYDQIVLELGNNKKSEVNFSIVRNMDTLQLAVPVNDKGKIGVYPKPMSNYLTFETVDYSFFEAIPAGFSKGGNEVKSYLKQLKLIFSPKTKAYESLGGFITIGSIFPPTWDWQAFWNLTAFISIILAVMNILPIPALDGGHVMILFYEMISGRKPSEKFLEYTQIAGLVIVLGLVIFANMNDVIRLFK